LISEPVVCICDRAERTRRKALKKLKRMRLVFLFTLGCSALSQTVDVTVVVGILQGQVHCSFFKAINRKKNNFGQMLCLVCGQWQIEKFWRGGDARKTMCPVVLYRKCGQRTICLLYVKKRLLKKILNQ